MISSPSGVRLRPARRGGQRWTSDRILVGKILHFHQEYGLSFLSGLGLGEGCAVGLPSGLSVGWGGRRISWFTVLGFRIFDL